MENGQPKAWPLLGSNIRYLAPANVSFPSALEAYEEIDLSAFGFETFIEAAQPSFDALTHKAVEATPAKVGGQWTRQWTIVALTQEEITASAKAKVPQIVTARQGMAELIDRELLATVQAALDAIPGKAGALARNDFVKAQEWDRSWPLIAQMQQALGWSDQFIDEMFIAAKAR